ncbi:cyclase family protein [Ponticaulis profundi]|uniref:Cyclase family protein n=1 Tax=Ponticaulis profundi TaxID=2665222 RepID=A0ABW1S8Q9_9PROT
MRHLLLTCAAASLFGLAHAQEAEAPAVETPAEATSEATDWTQSRWGEDDRLGAVNILTPEKTLAASKLITTGKTYALAQVTGRESAAYPPRSYDVVVLQPSDGSGAALGANKATGNDDIVRTYVGIGSQIDGLGHMGIDHRYYNGVHVSDFVTTAGLTQFGTQDIPPIATRGILLDMTKVFGESPLPDGTAFNRAEIDEALGAAGLTIEPGDVVIFHTGKMAASEGQPFNPAEPGLGVEGAEYLASLGVVAIGADSIALEVIPFEDETRPYEVHQTLLAKHGIYILENMVTDELASDGVTEFFFSLGVPRLQGTVQAMINPVAIR